MTARKRKKAEVDPFVVKGVASLGGLENDAAFGVDVDLLVDQLGRFFVDARVEDSQIHCLSFPVLSFYLDPVTHFEHPLDVLPGSAFNIQSPWGQFVLDFDFKEHKGVGHYVDRLADACVNLNVDLVFVAYDPPKGISHCLILLVHLFNNLSAVGLRVFLKWLLCAFLLALQFL